MGKEKKKKQKKKSERRVLLPGPEGVEAEISQVPANEQAGDGHLISVVTVPIKSENVRQTKQRGWVAAAVIAVWGVVVVVTAFGIALGATTWDDMNEVVLAGSSLAGVAVGYYFKD